MLKQTLSCFLCLLFAVPSLAQANHKQLEKEAKLKQKIVGWGTNKQVNVKLNSGEKISGRIALIQNEYFEIQAVAPDGKITTRQINYSEVNKLSGKTNAGKIAGYTTLGVLAAVGVTFIVILVVIRANE